VSVERINLTAGHSYGLSFTDADIAAGKTLLIDGSTLGANDSLTASVSSDTDGIITIDGGAGDDTLSGGQFKTHINAGAGDDTIYLWGGVNTALGGDGDDIFRINGPISSSSHIDGGAGTNQVFFEDIFSGTQVLGKNMGENITAFAFYGNNDYKIVLDNGMIAAGQMQHFYANSLTSAYSIDFNASHNHQGDVYLQGGAGNDVLIGGTGNDDLEGRGGVDKMTGGAGADTFYFDQVSDSTSSTFDRITDFNASVDHIGVVLAVGISAIDPTVTTGALSSKHFDTSLANAVGSSQLLAHDAVLFEPTTGYMHGHTFLIVDANGEAGYQAGADYVIDVTGMTGTLTTSSL
jgi:Ca2+-binding RTX toxin-like protein